jgi:hypothetical protein
MQKSIKVALTVIFGLFALPALTFGLYLVTCSIRIHTTNVYYVEYPYLAAASVFVVLGAAIFRCVLYAAWRRSFYGSLFGVGVIFGLATMAYIPDGIPHVDRSMIGDSNYMSSVKSFLGVWRDVNRRFPKNETEFSEAMKSGPAAWQNRVESPPTLSFYSQGGHRLPYEIVVVNDASGPQLDNVSNRPGVIYYAVSSDQQQYWVTMTGLHNDASRTATLKRWVDRPDEKPVVLSSSGWNLPFPVH